MSELNTGFKDLIIKYFTPKGFGNLFETKTTSMDDITFEILFDNYSITIYTYIFPTRVNYTARLTTVRGYNISFRENYTVKNVDDLIAMKKNILSLLNAEKTKIRNRITDTTSYYLEDRRWRDYADYADYHEQVHKLFDKYLELKKILIALE